MKIVTAKQYDPEWWEARRGIPTASEFGRIVTPKKWEPAAGADTYICELIAQLYDHDYGMVSDFATAAMKNGTIMEPTARRYYEFETGLDVQQVGFCVSDCGRFGCSPDGLVGDDGGLELKMPQPATHIKWLLSGKVPDEHLAQCHGGLLVSKRKWWDFMSWYPGLPPLLVRVTPDAKTVALAEALEKFYERLVATHARITNTEPTTISNGEYVSPF